MRTFCLWTLKPTEAEVILRKERELHRVDLERYRQILRDVEGGGPRPSVGHSAYQARHHLQESDVEVDRGSDRRNTPRRSLATQSCPLEPHDGRRSTIRKRGSHDVPVWKLALGFCGIVVAIDLTNQGNGWLTLGSSWSGSRRSTTPRGAGGATRERDLAPPGRRILYRAETPWSVDPLAS
jgi:hypothetical protein